MQQFLIIYGFHNCVRLICCEKDIVYIRCMRYLLISYMPNCNGFLNSIAWTQKEEVSISFFM